MKTITKTPDQISGILSVIAIPVDAVQSITDTTIQVNYNHVYHFKPSNDSGQYTRNQQQNNAGVSYLQVVTLFIQGLDQGKDIHLAEAVKHEFILLIQNENGTWSRVGSLEEPFQIIVDVQTESPGLTIRFTTETLSTTFPLTIVPVIAADLILNTEIILPPTT